MANPNNKFAYLPSTRKHVNAGWKWAHEVGTDYWLHPTSGLDQAAGASTALGPLLATCYDSVPPTFPSLQEEGQGTLS